jgi:hypothetical protein
MSDLFEKASHFDDADKSEGGGLLVLWQFVGTNSVVRASSHGVRSKCLDLSALSVVEIGQGCVSQMKQSNHNVFHVDKLASHGCVGQSDSPTDSDFLSSPRPPLVVLRLPGEPVTSIKTYQSSPDRDQLTNNHSLLLSRSCRRQPGHWRHVQQMCT